METTKLIKKIQASQSLKREVDLYRRLKQASKRIDDKLEVLKTSLLSNGIGEIEFDNRKIASITLQSRVSTDAQKLKDDNLFEKYSKESQSLFLRLH